MEYKLGKNIEEGQRILMEDGWYKVTKKHADYVVLEGGRRVDFGDKIFGWKIK